MKQLKSKSYRDFSKGTWQSVASSLAPENSVKFGLNMDSDVILGELVERKGATIVTGQLVDGYPILGLHNHRTNIGTDKLFAVVSDGTNSDIYDVVAGTKSLEDDTADLDTNFLTFLDSTLRLNGTDDAKAYNGTDWDITGGAFDVANLPTGSKYAIEFKDQVLVAGRTDSPDRIDKSSIADATTKTISWTTGTGLGYIIPEQEDGGGGITGLAKVPGYAMFFKRRTLKRWDGVSTYPEDLVNQGSPSQKAIVMCKGMVFWINENDAWASSGGDPKGIGSFMVREVIKSISASDLLKVAGGTDEEHIFWSIPSCTISGETYTNIVLKYNIFQNTWDIRKYATLPRCFCKTLDTSDEVYVTFGDDDGNVLTMDYGTTDNGTAITYSIETQDLEFGQRMFQKEINRMGVLTENVSKGTLMWRNTHNVEDWKPIGTIQDEVEDFATKLKGNFFNFKITETNDSGQAKFKGLEFPDGAVTVLDNSK